MTVPMTRADRARPLTSAAISRRMSRAVAPSATRMPISRVRCATPYESSAYSPISASPRASAPAVPSTAAATRTGTSAQSMPFVIGWGAAAGTSGFMASTAWCTASRVPAPAEATCT